MGYVRGASDRVPEALQRAGLPVTLLDAAALERGDLGRFGVIVIGPRAYETDSALVENNARLLAYVRGGWGADGAVPAAPVLRGWLRAAPAHRGRASARPRPARGAPVGHGHAVTDRPRPVPRPLAPADPVTVLVPNRCWRQRADWEGWIQERGLYFARTWDPAYRPLLETHDPGEPPLEGGLLVAKVGRGTYVYTGL